jgi:hypothetical protein
MPAADQAAPSLARSAVRSRWVCARGRRGDPRAAHPDGHGVDEATEAALEAGERALFRAAARSGEEELMESASSSDFATSRLHARRAIRPACWRTVRGCRRSATRDSPSPTMIFVIGDVRVSKRCFVRSPSSGRRDGHHRGRRDPLRPQSADPVRGPCRAEQAPDDRRRTPQRASDGPALPRMQSRRARDGALAAWSPSASAASV